MSCNRARIVRRAAGLASVLASVSIACSDQSGPNTGDPLDATPYVTGAALASLQGGRFPLPEPTPGSPPQITRARAESIAIAFRNDYGPLISGWVSQERGTPVDVPSLVRCGTPSYATSPYLPVDPALAADERSAPEVRAFGPWWRFPFCDAAGLPTILVLVSGYDTDLWFSPDGHVLNPPMGGEWFHWQTLPYEPVTHGSTAEEAVAFAWLNTGRRTVAVPELVSRPYYVCGPWSAQWRLTLEAPAAFGRAGSRELEFAAVVYVGPEGRMSGLRLHLPRPTQPERDSLLYNIADTIGQPSHPPIWRTLVVTRRPDVAVLLDTVTAVPLANP
jgi:hypothetical protein